MNRPPRRHHPSDDNEGDSEKIVPSLSRLPGRLHEHGSARIRLQARMHSCLGSRQAKDVEIKTSGDAADLSGGRADRQVGNQHLTDRSGHRQPVLLRPDRKAGLGRWRPDQEDHPGGRTRKNGWRHPATAVRRSTASSGGGEVNDAARGGPPTMAVAAPPESPEATREARAFLYFKAWKKSKTNLNL
jgi:hypothetical protein